MSSLCIDTVTDVKSCLGTKSFHTVTPKFTEIVSHKNTMSSPKTLEENVSKSHLNLQAIEMFVHIGRFILAYLRRGEDICIYIYVYVKKCPCINIYIYSYKCPYIHIYMYITLPTFSATCSLQQCRSHDPTPHTLSARPTDCKRSDTAC